MYTFKYAFFRKILKYAFTKHTMSRRLSNEYEVVFQFLGIQEQFNFGVCCKYFNRIYKLYKSKKRTLKLYCHGSSCKPFKTYKDVIEIIKKHGNKYNYNIDFLVYDINPDQSEKEELNKISKLLDILPTGSIVMANLILYCGQDTGQTLVDKIYRSPILFKYDINMVSYGKDLVIRNNVHIMTVRGSCDTLTINGDVMILFLCLNITHKVVINSVIGCLQIFRKVAHRIEINGRVKKLECNWVKENEKELEDIHNINGLHNVDGIVYRDPWARYKDQEKYVKESDAVITTTLFDDAW